MVLLSCLTQTEVMETDGFQADTEDDDEDTDCIIISTQSGELSSITGQEEDASLSVLPFDLIIDLGPLHTLHNLHFKG